MGIGLQKQSHTLELTSLSGTHQRRPTALWLICAREGKPNVVGKRNESRYHTNMNIARRAIIDFLFKANSNGMTRQPSRHYATMQMQTCIVCGKRFAGGKSRHAQSLWLRCRRLPPRVHARSPRGSRGRPGSARFRRSVILAKSKSPHCDRR